MAALIDSSVWVHYFRAKTPPRLKAEAAEQVDRADACLSEPTRFEILSAAFSSERAQILEVFSTLPLLQTPADLWERARTLGQTCIDRGVRPTAMDLLIAAIAIFHSAELISYDQHFANIAKHSELQVLMLSR